MVSGRRARRKARRTERRESRPDRQAKIAGAKEIAKVKYQAGVADAADRINTSADIASIALGQGLKAGIQTGIGGAMGTRAGLKNTVGGTMEDVGLVQELAGLAAQKAGEAIESRGYAIGSLVGQGENVEKLGEKIADRGQDMVLSGQDLRFDGADLRAESVEDAQRAREFLTTDQELLVEDVPTGPLGEFLLGDEEVDIGIQSGADAGREVGRLFSERQARKIEDREGRDQAIEDIKDLTAAERARIATGGETTGEIGDEFRDALKDVPRPRASVGEQVRAGINLTAVVPAANVGRAMLLRQGGETALDKLLSRFGSR